MFFSLAIAIIFVVFSAIQFETFYTLFSLCNLLIKICITVIWLIVIYMFHFVPHAEERLREVPQKKLLRKMCDCKENSVTSRSLFPEVNVWMNGQTLSYKLQRICGTVLTYSPWEL
jgi:hypothetical protein